MTTRKLVRCLAIDAKDVLVNHTNRGGLMLSVHNARNSAAVIHAGGADRKQLTNAACIELCDEGPQREINLQKNHALIRRSNGPLAEIDGEVRK